MQGMAAVEGKQELDLGKVVVRAPGKEKYCASEDQKPVDLNIEQVQVPL